MGMEYEMRVKYVSGLEMEDFSVKDAAYVLVS